MPYAPPCGNHQHTSVVCPCTGVREDVRVQKKYETQTGILDTCLDGECPAVLVRKLEQRTCTESDAEGEEIVQEHYKEDILDTCHEHIQIACEDDYDHGDEDSYGKILERFLQYFRNLRKILSAEDTENEGNTHDDEDALEDLSERDLKFRKSTDAMVACEVQVHLSPESEVERGGYHAGCRVEGCQRD